MIKNSNEKIGVVLFQLGGPDSLSAIEPFLFNLFNDPDIINFPLSFLVRKQLARFISKKRTAPVAQHYSLIGGKSPIGEITMRQADALERELQAHGSFHVFVAMRYCNPSTQDVIRQLQKENISKIILLPLYPQFSISTTGSSVNEWKRQIESSTVTFRTSLINEYPTHPTYIKAIVERIQESLIRFPENERNSVHVLFSAHGTPLKLVKAGDPYKFQIEKTKQAILETGNFGLQSTLSFQSRMGPQRWVEPFTTDTIRHLARKGIRNLLVVPISFVSDHIETLYELNIEARTHAEQNGIRQFEVIKGLNTSQTFISALKELVLNQITQAQFIKP